MERYQRDLLFLPINTVCPNTLKQRYTTNRFLPLALRLLMTRLPCFVDILFKNPCVLARFTLLGWYVRFITFRPYMYLSLIFMLCRTYQKTDRIRRIF